MEKDINKHLHIVFAQEHFNPLGIIRTLGEEKIHPIAIIIKNDRPVVSKSKYISKLHLVNTIEEGYELLMKQYGNNARKPFIYTTDDQITSLLDKNYEELKEKFNFFNAKENYRITYFMDKDKINNIAIKHGLNVAKTWIVEVGGEIPKDIEFPIITKPIVPTIDNWKSEEVVCENREELIEAYKNMQSDKILLQKYVNKKNELAIEGFSINHGKDVFYAESISFNYMLRDKYSHYMTVRKFENKDLESKINKLFEEIGFEGIFEVEFLVDEDDILYFLEINFRPSAWNYSATIAKMPLPTLWAKATLSEKIQDNYYKDFEPFTAMSEPDDIRNRVKTRQITVRKWLKDFKECKCHYYVNKKDMKPVWSIIKTKILK